MKHSQVSWLAGPEDLLPVYKHGCEGQAFSPKLAFWSIVAASHHLTKSRACHLQLDAFVQVAFGLYHGTDLIPRNRRQNA